MKETANSEYELQIKFMHFWACLFWWWNGMPYRRRRSECGVSLQFSLLML